VTVPAHSIGIFAEDQDGIADTGSNQASDTGAAIVLGPMDKRPANVRGAAPARADAVGFVQASAVRVHRQTRGGRHPSARPTES